MSKLKLIIGSFFYGGFLPNAPGTWGGFFALFFIYFIGINFPVWGIPIFVIVTSLLTLWVSKECEKVWGEDPSPLIMDEFAGQGMAFIGISLAFPALNVFLLLVLGFLLFRFFDIRKPLGVNKLQELPGVFGILVDDLLAGFYAWISLEILIFLIYLI